MEVTIVGQCLKAMSTVKKGDAICITGGQKQKIGGFDVVKIGSHGAIEVSHLNYFMIHTFMNNIKNFFYNLDFGSIATSCDRNCFLVFWNDQGTERIVLSSWGWRDWWQSRVIRTTKSSLKIKIAKIFYFSASTWKMWYCNYESDLLLWTWK